MAPVSRQQRLLPPTAFGAYFSRQKTILYSDLPPSSRAAVPSHSIKTIAWSPLGNLIATGASDRTLRIWNPEKNQVKNSTDLRGHVGGIERVAWNPTREAELASLSTDGTLKFWDVRSKAAIGEVKTEHEGLTLAWSPDGEHLVMGSRKDVLVPISRSSLSAMGEYKQNIQTNQTVFSHSGKELIATTGDGQVKIFDFPSMSLLYALNASNSACACLEVSPTGDHLAVGASDALITLWDTTDFICVRSLAAMTGPVKTLSFSFDGSYIVGGSDEGNVLDIASVESGEYVHKLETGAPSSSGHPCVAWAPRNYMLAYSGEGPQALRIVGGLGSAS